jgi:putative component of toxin-antitoxin plasmid stabilization module
LISAPNRCGRGKLQRNRNREFRRVVDKLRERRVTGHPAAIRLNTGEAACVSTGTSQTRRGRGSGVRVFECISREGVFLVY